MENIIYLTDENDNRIDDCPNMDGTKEGFEGDIWIHVKNQPLGIKIHKGSYLHFSHFDLYADDGCYKVVDIACPGHYKVTKTL